MKLQCYTVTILQASEGGANSNLLALACQSALKAFSYRPLNLFLGCHNKVERFSQSFFGSSNAIDRLFCNVSIPTQTKLTELLFVSQRNDPLLRHTMCYYLMSL